MKNNIKNMLILLRPHQYIKNVFIFMPLFFVGQITDVETILNAVVAFIAFSISASAIYILNDYKDIEEDRQHPKKKYRPLASGAVSPKIAIALMIMLLVVGVSLMEILSFQAFCVLCIYIIINFSYSFYLKHIAILDITIVAIGFVLRLFVGSAVTEVPLSMWIIIMTYLLALFLALAKRREEVMLFISLGKTTRKVISGYNLQLIDSAMTIMASVVIVAYILYATSSEIPERMHAEYLYLTALFVILGVLRYLQITLVENNSGSPTNILIKDKFLQVTVLLWISSFVYIIYL